MENLKVLSCIMLRKFSIWSLILSGRLLGNFFKAVFIVGWSLGTDFASYLSNELRDVAWCYCPQNGFLVCQRKGLAF
eukprot:c1098_g1_i1 orf=3-230(-)